MRGAREPSTPRLVILAVDQDADALGRVERELRARYEADYRVACEHSAEDALGTLRSLEVGEDVALVLAALRMEGMGGALGAKLFVLNVVDEHLLFRSGIRYGRFVGMLSEDGRKATGKVSERAREAGVECEELLVLGRPGRTILAVAEELGADPVVLGAEGIGRLEHAFIGSVSEEALRNANRTVIVVGGHPEETNGKDDTGAGP